MMLYLIFIVLPAYILSIFRICPIYQGTFYFPLSLSFSFPFSLISYLLNQDEGKEGTIGLSLTAPPLHHGGSSLAKVPHR